MTLHCFHYLVWLTLAVDIEWSNEYVFLQKSWKLNHVHCFYLLENGIQRKLVLIPLGARLGLVTQPRYEAPGDRRVEIWN